MEILGPVLMILLVVSGIPLLCGLLVGYFLGKAKGRRLGAAEGGGAASSGRAPYGEYPYGQAPPGSTDLRSTPGTRGSYQAQAHKYPAHRIGTAAPQQAPDHHWRSDQQRPVSGTADPATGQVPDSQPPVHRASAGDGPTSHQAAAAHTRAGHAPAGEASLSYPPPSYPHAAYARRPDLFEEERETERKRRESRGINIALYIGGLLLTTAALLFTAAVGDPAVTAWSLAGAFVAFAGGGLALALRSEVLRPAGVALFGTSLALLPILGVPLNEALIGSGFLTWFIISAVGLGVYGYGAVVLDSRVLGYLVIPFLYSSIVAATAVVQWALLWTLVGIIVLSALVQIGMLLAAERVPKVLRIPFGTLHPLVVPAVLFAALLLVDDLHARDYAVLFGVCALQYAMVSALDGPVVRSLVHRLAARVLATLAVVAVLIAVEVHGDTAGLVLSAWMALMYIVVSWVPGVSAAASRQYGGALRGSEFFRWDRFAVLLVALCCGLGFQVPLLAQTVLSGREHGFLGAQALLMVGVLALAAWSRFLPAALLRVALGAATVLAVINHPYYALGWALLWLFGEFVVATPPERARWQRGVGVVAGIAAGLTIGSLAEDPVLGQRVALSFTALLSAGIAAALILILRAQGSRAQEAWAYLGVFMASGMAGTSVFAIPVPAVPVYFAAVAIIGYGLLASAARRGSEPLQGSSALRLTLFGAAVLTGALLLADLDPARSAEAWAVLATAAILLLVEWCAAGVFRGAGSVARPIYRWGPVHLAANGTWLAAIHVVLVVAEAQADLYWFTAASWAVVYGMFAVQAADVRGRQGSATPMSLAGGRPAPGVPARSSYDRVLGGLYAVGVGLLAVGCLISAPSSWWVYVATGAAAIIVAALMVLTVASRAESAMSAPVYAAVGAALVALAGLDAVRPHSATATYLASLSAFCAALLVGAAGLLALRALAGTRIPAGGDAQRAPLARASARIARRQMLGSASVVAFAASLVPMAWVVTGESHALAWLVPAMHLLLVWPAVRATRHGAALGGSVLIPLTILWAWYQWDRSPEGAPGGIDFSAAVAGALLLVIVALLLSEVLVEWIPSRPADPSVSGPGEASGRLDWSMVTYGTASAVTIVLALLGLQSHGAVEQLAPILAATMLMIGGLARSRRLGIYFGAVVIVLAVLRWLSQWMFLFLIFLGVIIIGAAVWRLIVIQRRGTRPVARPAPDVPSAARPGPEQGGTHHTP